MPNSKNPVWVKHPISLAAFLPEDISNMNQSVGEPQRASGMDEYPHLLHSHPEVLLQHGCELKAAEDMIAWKGLHWGLND